MSGETSYQRWTLEEAALDAALSNAAQAALHGVNRGGPRRLERIGNTEPQQFVAIGTLEELAALVTEHLRARDASASRGA
jgi:hypothetical protein